MSYLKLGFMKSDREGKGRIKMVEFMKVLTSILKTHKDDKETLDAIINYVKDENNENEVVFDKLNTIVEVF
jgi:Ca2+-binding EF-hand superfamily protein